MAVLRRMEKAGVRPNVVTYNKLLEVVVGAAAHGGASLQDGEGVLTKMRAAALSPDRDSFIHMLEVSLPWSCASVVVSGVRG